MKRVALFQKESWREDGQRSYGDDGNNLKRNTRVTRYRYPSKVSGSLHFLTSRIFPFSFSLSAFGTGIPLTDFLCTVPYQVTTSRALEYLGKVPYLFLFCPESHHKSTVFPTLAFEEEKRKEKKTSPLH